ncbi:DUF5131 family protein [Teredinibacter purpureus]|uniref:DUF5131 family protein n=1 Tax=Teredinibacter purpureus TaxID=2731756 RepID=UPI0006972DE3|nr:phage Gp37/Gp68 family protein [Teredinibacter purpureus]
MGENTLISWANYTFNPVIGCEKVSPGCDNCYAESWDKRFGGVQWQKSAPRRVTSESNWRKPLVWNRKEQGAISRPRVFCGSMCDVFDKKIPPQTRSRLWELIKRTENLDWLLLTKRAVNIAKYLPHDWGDGYPNVWLGVSVENKKHGYPRIEILKNIPAKVRFLSAEPLLEEINDVSLNAIDWLIVGGESGHNCRPMDPKWADGLRMLCKKYNTKFYFKQMGGTRHDKGGCLLQGQKYQSVPQPDMVPIKVL